MLQCLTERLYTEGSIERVGELPGNNKTAEPVQDSHQIYEAMRHEHGGNVKRHFELELLAMVFPVFVTQKPPQPLLIVP